MRPRLRLLALASLLTLNTTPAHSTTIVLDGLRDPAYVLLATDPAGDIPESLMLALPTEWIDLTALYVYTTTTDLYVYVDLPAYGLTVSSGQIGLALDLTGYVPNSGGAADPWSNLITYAFTSTHDNLGGLPLTTNHTLLPDVVIRGNIPSEIEADADENDGWTELRVWTGSVWSGAGVSWGGLEIESPQLGTHIAYADGNGVELAIPLADLGVPISGTVHLHFYTTQTGAFHGAYDSLPSDWPVTSAYSPTVQHNFATLHFPVSPTPDPPSLAFTAADFQASEADVATSITLTASGVITQPISALFQALPGTASALDFVPLTTTVVLSPALTTAPVTVTLLADDDPEPSETILLSLSAPVDAVLGQPAAAVLTLLDDDSPQSVLLRVLLPLIVR